MASVCVNNVGIAAGESFLDRPAAGKTVPCAWIKPPIEELEESSAPASLSVKKPHQKDAEDVDLEKVETPETDMARNEFEFRPEHSISSILPADELFSDGKLVPLQQTLLRHSTAEISTAADRRNEIPHEADLLSSPKAPTCSGRWIEILRLRKVHQSNENNPSHSKTVPSRSLKMAFLQRGPKSHPDSSPSLPLQRLEKQPPAISPRISQNPRPSVDSDRPAPASCNASQNNLRAARHRASMGRSTANRAAESTVVSLDSPRMNPSGKIVYNRLERSSSSPVSLNGAPGHKHRGMERSYSGGVRIAPVLNVPIRITSKSSVFGFPFLPSKQKKDFNPQAHSHGGNGGTTKGGNQAQNIPNKTTQISTSR